MSIARESFARKVGENDLVVTLSFSDLTSGVFVPYVENGARYVAGEEESLWQWVNGAMSREGVAFFVEPLADQIMLINMSHVVFARVMTWEEFWATQNPYEEVAEY